jgi:hypothetical protein
MWCPFGYSSLHASSSSKNRAFQQIAFDGASSTFGRRALTRACRALARHIDDLARTCDRCPRGARSRPGGHAACPGSRARRGAQSYAGRASAARATAGRRCPGVTVARTPRSVVNHLAPGVESVTSGFCTAFRGGRRGRWRRGRWRRGRWRRGRWQRARGFASTVDRRARTPPGIWLPSVLRSVSRRRRIRWRNGPTDAELAESGPGRVYVDEYS